MSKYSKNILYEEMEAEEYAEEEAYYQYQDEKRVKENRPEEEKDQPPKPEPAPKPAPKQVVPVKQKEVKHEETEIYLEKEIVLESFDDWEEAMDALDTHVSAIEAQKAQKK